MWEDSEWEFDVAYLDWGGRGEEGWAREDQGRLCWWLGRQWRNCSRSCWYRGTKTRSYWGQLYLLQSSASTNQRAVFHIILAVCRKSKLMRQLQRPISLQKKLVQWAPKRRSKRRNQILSQARPKVCEAWWMYQYMVGFSCHGYLPYNVKHVTILV